MFDKSMFSEIKALRSRIDKVSANLASRTSRLRGRSSETNDEILDVGNHARFDCYCTSFLMTYHYSTMAPVVRPVTQRPSSLKSGGKYDVKACKVLDGHIFHMCLEGDEWIEAHLKVSAKDEARAVVVGWLNKATPPSPSVTLLRQTDSHWIVEFELTVEGKRESMVDLCVPLGCFCK
jgi:hypothetical protein